MWQDGVMLLGCTGQPPGYGSGQMGGRSGDVQSSAAIHGSSPISLCGRPGLPPDYKPKPGRDGLEMCDGGVLVKKFSFPAPSPAQHHYQ